MALFSFGSSQPPLHPPKDKQTKQQQQTGRIQKLARDCDGNPVFWASSPAFCYLAFLLPTPLLWSKILWFSVKSAASSAGGDIEKCSHGLLNGAFPASVNTSLSVPEPTRNINAGLRISRQKGLQEWDPLYVFIPLLSRKTNSFCRLSIVHYGKVCDHHKKPASPSAMCF